MISIGQPLAEKSYQALWNNLIYQMRWSNFQKKLDFLKIRNEEESSRASPLFFHWVWGNPAMSHKKKVNTCNFKPPQCILKSSTQSWPCRWDAKIPINFCHPSGNSRAEHCTLLLPLQWPHVDRSLWYHIRWWMAGHGCAQTFPL